MHKRMALNYNFKLHVYTRTHHHIQVLKLYRGILEVESFNVNYRGLHAPSHILIKTHEYDYFSDLSIQYLVCTIKSLFFLMNTKLLTKIIYAFKL